MKQDDASTPPVSPDPLDPGGPGVLRPPPASAAAIFGDRMPLAVRYADLLAGDGVLRGLIGPREAPRLWERHLLNCALLAPALPPDATVVDIGSGAGLPGIVLAIVRPDISITLLEPLLRRTTFLDEVVDSLGLDNVTVVRGRADALHGHQQFDVVTSRAVAPLERLLGWSMPLVAPHGALVAMKGSSAADEVAGASATLRKLRCAAPTIEILGSSGTILSEPVNLSPTADRSESLSENSVDGVSTSPEDRRGDDLGIDPIQVVRVTWADPAGVSLRLRAAGGSDSRGPRSGTARSKRRKS